MAEFIYYDTLNSTNETAKQLATDGANEGTVIIAKHQTCGRGRLGRSFYSPSGTGLYLSIILRPTFPLTQNLLITPAAAVAVATAIEDLFNLSTKIKWVNDIFVKGKKVCGILSEAELEQGDKTKYIILGIGVNIFKPACGFPDDIKGVAGALLDAPDDRAATRLAEKIVNNFFDLYKNLNSNAIYKEYQSRLMLKGKRVFYTKNGNEQSGTVMDIDKAYNLLIKTDAGNVIPLMSGEISLGSAEAVK